MRPSLIDLFRKKPEIANAFLFTDMPTLPKTKEKPPLSRAQEARIPWAKERKNSNDSKKRRLYIKQNGVCAYCPYIFKSNKDCTLDHIKPRSKGGTKEIKNLALVCIPCNQLKADHQSLSEVIDYCEKRVAFFKHLKELGYVE